MVELPFFKKKKEPEIVIGKGFIPVDRVREMASRGFSEPEMVDVLRKEGFSPEEIDRALTHVLKVATEAKPTEQKEKLPTLDEISPQKPVEEILAAPETVLPQEYAPSPGYTTEDYIDYVIQERMKEVNEKLEKVEMKFGEIEKRVEKIGEQLSESLKVRSSEQQQIIGRIDSFSDTVNDVNIRVASLEKAFKETLPALIESVRALSDLVQRLKKEA